MFNGYGFSNQNMINQLMRQKDNIDNLINQYSQPQAPVQNIINTAGVEFEARILKENEEVENILISKRTMFLDEQNKKLYIKELDGTISKTYDIVIPLDEKDKKILDLENKLKEMEEKYEHTKCTCTNIKQQKSISDDNELNDTTTATNG